MSKSTEPTYTERALALLGNRNALDVLAELASELPRALAGVEAPELERRESPDGWSVHQVLGHMLDTELVYGYRLRLTLLTEAPGFERFDQERWVERFESSAGDVATCLERLASMRGWHLDLIRSITASEALRTSSHSGRGVETVQRMVDLWAAHDLMHRAQIQRILGAAG